MADIAPAGAAGAWSEGPAGPGDRPVLRCLGHRRDLGPAASGLAVALAGAPDLGILRGIGTEVALDGLARPHYILSVEGRGSAPDRVRTRRASRAKVIGVLHPSDVRQTPAPLPDASRTIVGTRAGFDLLPVDEALDLADDVGAARIIFHTASIIVCMSGIIVGTDGIIARIPVMIVGMGRIIVSAALIIVDTDRYVVGTRGNEVSGRGNEVSARGTEPGRERDP